MRCLQTVACLALACLVLAATGCALLPDHKLKAFQKVQPGMTLAQVQGLMGPPKGVDPPLVLKEGEAPTRFYIWESNRDRFAVTVSADGKVLNTGYSAR